MIVSLVIDLIGGFDYTHTHCKVRKYNRTFYSVTEVLFKHEQFESIHFFSNINYKFINQSQKQPNQAVLNRGLYYSLGAACSLSFSLSVAVIVSVKLNSWACGYQRL